MWEIKIPKTESTVREATLIKWYKKEGEKVTKGEVIAEVETFKATVEITSSEDGILYKKFVNEGETMPVNAVIAILAKEGEKVSPEAIKAFSQAKEKAESLSTSKSSFEEKVKAAPAARKLAQERNIDLTFIKGSGPAGVITKEDVESYLQKERTDFSIKEARKLTGVRKVTAQRLSFSYQSIPQFTLHRKVDITQVAKIRSDINAQCGFHLSLVDFVLKALIYTLEKFPEFNAVFEEDTHKLIEEINIGIAIATEKGLVVPVIRNLKEKKVFEIAQTRESITEQALQGKLQPKDFEGGTFTVTNLGLQEIEYFTPLINPPQVAILGIGKAESSLPLSLSIDHRVIDGVQGAMFLQFLSEMLALPYRFLF